LFAKSYWYDRIWSIATPHAGRRSAYSFIKSASSEPTYRASANADHRRERVLCVCAEDLFSQAVPMTTFIEWMAACQRSPSLDKLVVIQKPDAVENRLREAAGYLSRRSSIKVSPLRDWVASWLEGHPPLEMWLGLSLHRQSDANHYVSQLLTAPAAHRFLVFDPLLGPLSLTHLPPISDKAACCEQLRLDALLGQVVCDVSEQVSFHQSRIELVIAGGSGCATDPPTHPVWLRALRNECMLAHVDFAFTGWGSWAPVAHSAHAADDDFCFEDGTRMRRLSASENTAQASAFR